MSDEANEEIQFMMNLDRFGVLPQEELAEAWRESLIRWRLRGVREARQ